MKLLQVCYDVYAIRSLEKAGNFLCIEAITSQAVLSHRDQPPLLISPPCQGGENSRSGFVRNSAPNVYGFYRSRDTRVAGRFMRPREVGAKRRPRLDWAGKPREFTNGEVATSLQALMVPATRVPRLRFCSDARSEKSPIGARIVQPRASALGEDATYFHKSPERATYVHHQKWHSAYVGCCTPRTNGSWTRGLSAPRCRPHSNPDMIPHDVMAHSQFD